jgi:hypothetical protein
MPKHVYKIDLYGGAKESNNGHIHGGTSNECPEPFGSGFRYVDAQTGNEVIVSGPVVIERYTQGG